MNYPYILSLNIQYMLLYFFRTIPVCEYSLCPRKQPYVSGPGLGEAGRYKMVSEPTLAVSQARTGVSAVSRARTGVSAEA